MRRLLIPLLCALVPSLPPGAARADEAATDLKTLKSCLANKAANERGCIDTVAGPCMEAPDGETTVGISACLDREQAAWDAVLNQRYGVVLKEAGETDASLVGSAAAPDPLPAAGSLKKAQRAWVTFRDAECDRLYAIFQEGTIRANVFSSCQRDLTAERAIQLAPSDR